MSQSQQTRSLVTGASAGIGLALVKQLAAAGHLVFGCARNIEVLKILDCEGASNIHPIVCDVSDEEQVKVMFEEITRVAGGLDICVNNAAIVLDASVLTGAVSNWRRIYEVNVVGLCLVTQNAVQCMKEGGGDDCKILNVNSTVGIAASRFDIPYLGFCIGCKHAVTGITSALRGELSQSGLAEKIRVMQIYPHFTETTILHNSIGKEAADEVYSKNKPLQPADVASSILHALSTPKHATVTDLVLYGTDSI